MPLPLLPRPPIRRTRRPLRTPFLAVLAACVLGAAAVLVGAAPASAATPLPVDYNFVDGVAAALANPTASPPGANVWSCKPTTQHPFPVVLVNGTGEDMADGFSAISPLLVNNGYCVFAANFGGTPGSLIQGTGDIAQSAAQLSTFVNQVLAATGATQVNLVGHSQGGMMPRYYLKFLGGAPKVHTLVGLAPSNHGTTLDGITTLSAMLTSIVGQAISGACTACTQQVAGSAFLTALNAGGDTVPGPTYTVIETRFDEIVTPYTSAFLTGPKVTNITLQNVCLLDAVDHIGIADDTVALHLMLNALDPAHPQHVPCVPIAPIVGGGN